MKVFIAGIDGYLGWPLAQYLTSQGHEVAGADKMLRREWVAEVDSMSAFPVYDHGDRLIAFKKQYGTDLDFRVGDLCDYDFVKGFFADFQPDAIVHLAQMPSAPYSMMDQKHSVWTQVNNVTTNMNILWAMKETVPHAHLVKLGTMGEYGQPNIDIAEGFFEVEYRGRKDRLPFPRQAGSWYHQSKVHDSHNTMFASKIWGLRATDIMQGVVFGTQWPDMGDDPRLRTRFDFDQSFGTAMNRFCAQAVVDHPLTLYGAGTMKRGFLPLRDSMRCLQLTIENPPEEGEFRVFNQFAESYSIIELAEVVKEVGTDLGMDVAINHYDNPRGELEHHYYNPDRNNLVAIGYEPTQDVKTEVKLMLEDLRHHADRIRTKIDILVPDIRWDGSRRRSKVVEPVRS
ncbi:MAG: NAD-dependent epimerase/dehydratase family protein [Anaerolineaceae bacterium]|nr:NAD-dependent epimerase/dehydratase family protein [Anaerolineaceae bacterium]